MEAILLSSKTIEELNLNAETVTQGINQTFAAIRDALEKRRNELLSEAEAVRYMKEKRLKIQREELEFFSVEMRSCGEFARGLVEKGSAVEVAMSKNPVLSRLKTLKMRSIEMSLPEDSTLRFNEEGNDEMIQAISVLGSISGNQTSAKASKIEWTSSSGPMKSKSVALKERVSFKILSVNKEGERIKRGGDYYSVDLADNSNTRAEIVDHIDGSYSVSLVPTVKGSHRVSVTFGGEDVQGSPFDLRVACASAKASYLEGCPFVTVNQSQELEIVAVDEDGILVKQGGENFTCSVTINNQPQTPPVITDLQNGIYQLKFTPTSSGKCSISVKLNGKQIKGSPMDLFFFGNDFFGGPKQFQVLYDAKVHGYSNQIFHFKCDNINGTVTFVTLQNGAKFGGYNAECWTSENAFKPAPGSFLFSLTDGKGSAPQKFALKESPYAIYSQPVYGPTFGYVPTKGGHDLLLNLDSRSTSHSKGGGSTYNLPNDNTLAGSHNNWSFVNVQVFRVI